MAGKGGKGLLAAKTTAAKAAADKDKDRKKAPVSRSSRAGIQVPSLPSPTRLSRRFIFFLVVLGCGCGNLDGFRRFLGCVLVDLVVPRRFCS
jgi:hypothetical protein